MLCLLCCFFFFFKQKTAYEIGVRLVGSEMCIRDRSIGFNDTQRILESVKPGDLNNQRQLRVQVESTPSVLNLFMRQVDILLAERVDTGRNQILRMRQRLRELRKREYARLILADPVS